MKNISYKDILSDDIKEAFRKGDAYYVSPFKNHTIRATLCNMSAKDTGSMYNTTSFARIYDAKRDSIISKQWN